MKNEEFEAGGKENSSNKILLRRTLVQVNTLQKKQPLQSWKRDGQVAQFECAALDRDHSAHRVYASA